MSISAAGGIGIAAGAAAGIGAGIGVWKLGTSGDHKPVVKPLLVSIALGGASYAALRGAAELGVASGRGTTAVGQAIGGGLGALGVIGAGLAVGLLGASAVNGVRRMFD